jgi:hypothetical protein
MGECLSRCQRVWVWVIMSQDEHWAVTGYGAQPLQSVVKFLTGMFILQMAHKVFLVMPTMLIAVLGCKKPFLKSNRE